MDISQMLGGFSQWAFFELLFGLINGEIEDFQGEMLVRATKWVAGMATVLCTIWVFMQGFLIVTGRSRDSMMGLVVNALRVYLIVIAATTLSFAGTDITRFLTDDLPNEIHQVVAGNNENVEEAIDDNLKTMGLIFALIDALPTPKATNNGEESSKDKGRVATLTGIGIAGPSVVGGAMLLLYKIALVLFVGFGPIFIMCLLFDQTKELFKRWLLYGIGTMFAMAVLSFMVSVATKVVAVSAGLMVVAYIAATDDGITGTAAGIVAGIAGSGDLNSAAMQQGGIGLLMSVLMVMAPPMAAMFFNGTLGQFVANSSFGNVGRNSTGQESDFKQRTVSADSSTTQVPTNPSVAATAPYRP